MTFSGTFHRRESNTQLAELAIRQVKSSEVWGRTPRGGMEPTVQAYAGQIKPGVRGIEFDTHTPPHNNGSPFEARWYLTLTPGVQLRQENGEDFACIYATVRNHQPILVKLP